jgi:hypothetical protein
LEFSSTHEARVEASRVGGTYIYDHHGSECADDAAEGQRRDPVPPTEAYLCFRNLSFGSVTFLGLLASAFACTFRWRSSSIRS